MFVITGRLKYYMYEFTALHNIDFVTVFVLMKTVMDENVHYINSCTSNDISCVALLLFSFLWKT